VGQYASGFASLDDEIIVEALPVTGAVPEWLSGQLVRNGPAKFEAGEQKFRHWFDGQAMLHRFAFEHGRVSYRNQFLDTPTFRAARDDGRIEFAEFATDPCRSLFARLFTWYRRFPSSKNTCVNVVPMADGVVALTETPIAVRFDPESLETLGIDRYDDDLTGNVTTAHPHQAPLSGDLVNYVLKFGRKSEYQVYRQSPGSMKRELVAAIPDDAPSYMHSFAITENYAVLAVFPFVVNPLSLLMRGKPFIQNYRWRPELGTRFVVVGLADGVVRGTYRTDAFFAFHHINAYEEGGDLVVDTSAYDDAAVIDALYLDTLRAGTEIPVPRPTRYRIGLDSGTVRTERLSEQPLELPRIDYGSRNGRPYRFAYGVSRREQAGDDFFDRLVKLDVTTGETRIWTEPGCYPGEPVFVSAPSSTSEDDGVVLCVVLDSASARSFMLVLDATSFTELARASVPHAIPFGFHGQFAAGN
jgi:carotenoid cleavage dioxygenase-like enzyme